jgi:hypothetical protein
MRAAAGWAWFCAVLVASAAPASASLFIEVYANNTVDESLDMQFTSSETSIHGTSGALGVGTSASAGEGPAGVCDFALEPPGTGCVYTGAHAAGEIRGDLGRLRAQAFVLDSPDHLRVSTLLTLTDVLTTQTAGPVSFNFFLDFVMGGDSSLLFQATLNGDTQVLVEEDGLASPGDEVAEAVLAGVAHGGADRPRRRRSVDGRLRISRASGGVRARSSCNNRDGEARR